MPIYLFKCPGCQKTREIIAPRFDYEPLCLEPGCAGYVMEKQPTAATFIVGGFNAKNGYSK